MSYLQNAWYPAAWAHEVDENFLARTYLDMPVLLYRNADGQAIALYDMCPHRFAPLSAGKLVEGKIRCGYHGLEFDEQGQCVGSCLGGVVPKVAKVRAFPIVEQDNIVWIWMGDEAPSDLASIPRFPFHNAHDTEVVYGVTQARSDYRLLSDNLMDLTHIHLLHPGFGGIEFPTKLKAHTAGDAVISVHVSDYPEAPAREDNIITWTAPSNHFLESITYPKNGESFTIPSAHLITPETGTSSYYFWSSGCAPGMDAEETRAFLSEVFDDQDKPMVEAVQRRMAGREFWDMKPLLLSNDAGAIMMRRKLTELIEAEAARRALAQA